MVRAFFLVVIIASFLGGCGTAPRNPSFPLTMGDARASLRQMREDPQPLRRPLVVLDGFLSPGVGSAFVGSEVRKLTDDDDQVVPVSFFGCSTFDECRAAVIAAVDERFPSDDPDATVEVDVIGLSMGGLVGRYAAAAKPGERRLKVARMFTIASPHRGAIRADLPAMGQLHRDMREGSAFLAQLDALPTPPMMQIVPYTRLNDQTVGEQNTAPPGASPWWVPNTHLAPAHLAAPTDPRILADIARRLRGQPPFTIDPPAPLPQS